MYTVESIPQQTESALPVEGKSTYETWMSLIASAKETLYIGQYYWTLGNGAEYPKYNGYMGAKVLDAIVDAKRRGVDVQIVRNAPGRETVGQDYEVLKAAGVQVTTANFTTLGLEGIFHTKMMVVDHVNTYVGSANSDWRSLTQVKEAGIAILDSKEFASDAERIFMSVRDAALQGTIPSHWPQEYSALFNAESPLILHDVNGISGNDAEVYMAVSPDPFCADRRTTALKSTEDLFHKAEETVDIEVMDYLPFTEYMKEKKYWGNLDDLIREAAFLGKRVRLLIGLWNHTKPVMAKYLASLNALDNIDVRWFTVPDLKGMEPVPYTRVNHAKFFVTDNYAYVSTNNWIADYFLSTHGINVIVNNEPFRKSLQSIFDRDWNSQYTKFLNQTGPVNVFYTEP